MSSVLDQTFQHQILLDERFRKDIERYCEREIGGRTYYLRQYRGGKTWRIANQVRVEGQQSKIVVELNDQDHAVFLSLKYA